MSRRTDSELVVAAREGRKDALAELVRRHWRTAWTRGFAITGRRELADDVAQDAVSAALQRLDRLDDPAAFNRRVTALLASASASELG